ncbi:MAG: tRNA (guanosine(46)-N7)-methyltransferase TrmB [Bacteroidaceae bacterium]|nr:tRNA (guanosine(46)-N7)-methyltransferase TrmB [Bacteroidaceae bacterium]
MGKGKLAKFAEMAENPLVVECPFWQLQQEGFPLKGKWHEEFFKNDNPIVLELGCGRGEYTIGLARRFPGKNFIGIDIKGARMWHGAKTALEEGMKNVAFLRTNIECIAGFFAENEVAELWLTFSDPQMKKATKRLTSTYFMERYRKFLIDGGIIHVKTDSNFLATYTKYMVEKNGLPMAQCTFDLYAEQEVDSSLTDIRTYYEGMWLERGIPIKYLQFRLPNKGILEEPDVEIPVDGYRSYNHQVVSTKKTGK